MDIRNWLKGKTQQKSAAKENADPPPDEEHEEDSESSETMPVVAGSSNTPAAPAEPAPATTSTTASSSPLSQTASPPEDLGAEAPNQVKINKYPTTIFGGKKRSFVSSWFHGRDWLEYSVQTDAAFCFPCRKFRSVAMLILHSL